MSMAEDAARQRAERQLADSRAATQEAARQKRNWNEIDASVREFVPIAKKTRIATRGVLKKHWTVIVHSFSNDPTFDRLAARTNIRIYTTGVWDLYHSDPDRYDTNTTDDYASSRRPAYAPQATKL